jgi:hypothetical protein
VVLTKDWNTGPLTSRIRQNDILAWVGKRESRSPSLQYLIVAASQRGLDLDSPPRSS